VDEWAAQTAATWRDGLAAWGQSPDRIARFRDAVDITIYTPGSTAGVPLAVLRSFAAGPAAHRQDAEAHRERIAAAASGLLGLLGIAGDPLRSREQILLSTILDQAWRAGRDLDLGQMIREIQSPGFDRVGVLDLESFFPAQERFQLAASLNNLLASPGFSAWMTGEPLDVQRLLFTPQGKPRLSIISIAHLADAERMFFVTLLLGEVIAWMRGQSGTSSLRALLYMDEVFGYFPPTANPPSKTPMLTLLKQARAYGLGVVLATQNPVDLDYKGLSTAGTWFLGRLQTERDKARVLEGLEGASLAAGAAFDRQQMEATLAGLGSRVFLMNNVHDDAPVVFQSRWALSYLRGPLTREQIQTLARRPEASAAPASPPVPLAAAAAAGQGRPMLPPGVPEAFRPRRAALAAGQSVLYRPTLCGTARAHFVQAASGVDLWQSVVALVEVDSAAAGIAWDQGLLEVGESPEWETEPAPGAAFAPLPAELARPKRYSELATALKGFVYRTHTLPLWKCPALKQVSRPGESEGDFRARLSLAAREARDAQLEKLRAKYAPKLAALQEQIRRAEQRVEREKSEAQQSTVQAAISLGSSVLGALFGRKLRSTANVTRAATSMRAAGRVARQRGDVAHAEESVEALAQRRDQLAAELDEQAEKIERAVSPESLQLESAVLQPRKADIAITRVTLLWTPWNVDATGLAEPAG
jgi:hypothetical protein